MKKHPRAVALGCFLLYFLFPLVSGSAVGIGFKIFLGCAAKRAGPILRKILVIGFGFYSVVNVTLVGLVNVSAKSTNIIHNFLRFLYVICLVFIEHYIIILKALLVKSFFMF